jgi:hypothetical protein
MGYDNTITVLDNGKETDITPKELQAIEKFKEAGMPGLTAVNDVVMTKALDLYLSNKTYHEISRTLGIKKEIILFLGQKFKWYETKMETFEIINATISERILHANLVNKDFVLQIQQFYLRKIGSKITKYLATGDEEIANQIDGKDLDRYQKYVELLDKISTEKPASLRQPAVGLNLGDGVTVKKVGENQIEITPRNKTAGEMIAELANLKRAEEASSKETYDITPVDTSKTKGDK